MCYRVFPFYLGPNNRKFQNLKVSVVHAIVKLPQSLIMYQCIKFLHNLLDIYLIFFIPTCSISIVLSHTLKYQTWYVNG